MCLQVSRVDHDRLWHGLRCREALHYAEENAPFTPTLPKALRRHGSPDAITTDGLRSYRAAMNELGNAEKQETGRWVNSRVENSHLPFRRRERAMQRFRRMKTLQKSASVHANVHNHFSLERHLIDRQTCRERRSAAQAEWQVLASYAACSKTDLHRVQSGSRETDSTDLRDTDRTRCRRRHLSGGFQLGLRRIRLRAAPCGGASAKPSRR
jgi:hypothetical protein